MRQAVPHATSQAEVTLVPESIEKLRELFEMELRFRRVFVAGKIVVSERERCSLILVHPLGGQFSIQAEAVYINRAEPGTGVGLDLVGLDAGRIVDLHAFIRGAGKAPGKDEAIDSVPEGASRKEGTVQDGKAAPDETPGTRNVYERIRNLSLPEREKVARRGQLSDRVALERSYGSSVWEGLLQNPMLTVPEVAQIAKKGTLPQALVAVILANGNWLASGEVRRALLGNPRVSGAHLDRVLKATPKAELKQIAQVSPYRSQVRAAAKKIFNE